MLAETSRHWQANLDGTHTVRGQGGKKGHTVALTAFAFLAESMPMERGKGGHRWGESSPSWSGDWTGVKMLRSQRYLRSCQVSLRPVRPSLWKLLSWHQKLSSIYLKTFLNASCCPPRLVKKRSQSQVQNVHWDRDTSGFKIHGHAWAAGWSCTALAIPTAGRGRRSESAADQSVPPLCLWDVQVTQSWLKPTENL